MPQATIKLNINITINHVGHRVRLRKHVREGVYLHLKRQCGSKCQHFALYLFKHSALGIRAVLTATRSGLLRHSKEDIPYYLYIPAEDYEEYQLSRHFGDTF